MKLQHSTGFVDLPCQPHQLNDFSSGVNFPSSDFCKKAATASVWYSGVGKWSLKPPPPSLQAFSAPITLFSAKSVPPTAVMYGDAAGKSGWYLPSLDFPVRPTTP